MNRELFVIENLSGAHDVVGLIEEALRVHHAVAIGHMDDPLELDRPIRLDSGDYLSVASETVIRMKPGCGGCMVRNRHVRDGRLGEMSLEGWDHDITVEGGIWEDAARAPSPNDPDPVLRSLSHVLLGTIFFSGVERVTVRNMTLRRGDQYGVLLAGCRDFHVSGIVYDDYRKDGVHVNGPSENGLIEDMRGHCGDDFVALNGWDWDTSAISFGTIRNIHVRRIDADGDEMRLLPGRKTYKNGTKTLCNIENCLYEDISGIYNFKMYQQPDCHNYRRAADDQDFSDIPGLIENVTFKRVHISVRGGGLAEVELDGIFEIGADCRGISYEKIDLDRCAEDMKAAGMALVTVGPKSSTWTQGYDDPARWSELFDPDLICTAEDILFRDVTMNDQPCLEAAALLSVRRLTVNLDYPHTTPRGGTGYGITRNVTIE